MSEFYTTPLSTTPAYYPAAAPAAAPSEVDWGLDLAPYLTAETWTPTAPPLVAGTPSYTPGLTTYVPYAAPAPQVSALSWPTANTSWLSGVSGLLDGISNRLLGWVALPVPAAPTPTPSQPANPVTPPQPTQAKPTDFVMASFNLLGDSHTKNGDNKIHRAAGPRTHDAIGLLKQYNVEIAGFQEMETAQYDAFMKEAGSQYGIYPGKKLGKSGLANSIVWRKDTWELVKPGSIQIPYFDGHKRPMPVVLLRNKKTGQEAYFANFHNPASIKKYGDQQKWRTQATNLEIALANRLMKESGLPVFITGDMNEKDEYYDMLTKGAPMTAASDKAGKKPSKIGIDWIFGSKGVKFSGYVRDSSSQKREISDHPLIVSKVEIPAKKS